MRFRIFVTVAVLVGFAGVGTLLARGACASAKVCCVEDQACCEAAASSCCEQVTSTFAKQWSTLKLAQPMLVNRALISGTVLIVHDDAKMARGEPCTTFYQFDPRFGRQQELVSFHCKPRRADKVSTTTLTTSDEPGVRRLLEYQLAGDSEAHGVPR